MKKTYITPMVKSVKINNEAILAESLNNSAGNGVQLGKESSFDEDWD